MKRESNAMQSAQRAHGIAYECRSETETTINAYTWTTVRQRIETHTYTHTHTHTLWSSLTKVYLFNFTRGIDFDTKKKPSRFSPSDTLIASSSNNFSACVLSPILKPISLKTVLTHSHHNNNNNINNNNTNWMQFNNNNKLSTRILPMQTEQNTKRISSQPLDYKSICVTIFLQWIKRKQDTIIIYRKTIEHFIKVELSWKQKQFYQKKKQLDFPIIGILLLIHFVWCAFFRIKNVSFFPKFITTIDFETDSKFWWSDFVSWCTACVWNTVFYFAVYWFYRFASLHKIQRQSLNGRTNEQCSDEKSTNRQRQERTRNNDTNVKANDQTSKTTTITTTTTTTTTSASERSFVIILKQQQLYTDHHHRRCCCSINSLSHNTREGTRAHTATNQLIRNG